MAHYSPTFVLGVVALLYLSSFIVFAILRIITGISIQRIGYFSLRHIAYTPRDGIKIEVRGLGLNLHRPTFAQPTWISLVLTELQVTLDIGALEGGVDLDTRPKANGAAKHADGPDCAWQPPSNGNAHASKHFTPGPRRSKTWDRLMGVKEKIKRLHQKINWLRMMDLVATNSVCTITDIGYLQIGSITMAVDTRRKMVDRNRLFRHRKPLSRDQRPAEWIFTLRSLLFTPEGKESIEIVDHSMLNVHGMLYENLNGLRDASISLKFGQVHIPYDDLIASVQRFQRFQSVHRSNTSAPETSEITLTDVMEELDLPGSREEKIAQTVSDSKDFISSILRGIKEFQFALGVVALSKEIPSIQPDGSMLYLNLAMKEVGLDLHRLDAKSPAHRMYFARNDVAHQALLAAISISVDIEDGHGEPERLAYIPMATATVKTTLPSKTMQFDEDRSAAERNANILFANIVVTSPSLDLDPKHLPLVVTLLKSSPKSASRSSQGSHRLISRLLPKANIKLSIHEPVVRVTLPPTEPGAEGCDDYDLLISSISAISLDLDSSHSAAGELHYSLASNFRIASHQLYYQTASGARHNLLLTDALELKVQLNASPEVHVAVSANLQTFSMHMVRPEISEGVRQIVRQLSGDAEPKKLDSPLNVNETNFLRRLPAWLLHVQIKGSDFSVEVAGTDSDVSESARGVALQLESWTAEYKAQRSEALEKKPSKRRSSSRNMAPDEMLLNATPPLASHRSKHHPTDGRRLATHIHGLEGFVIESLESWESEPFLSLPRFEVALSTTSDSQGPIFHLNTHIHTLCVHYSLYRYYAVGLATTVLRKAFVRWKHDPVVGREERRQLDRLSPIILESKDVQSSPESQKELLTIDIKADLLQVKATMPADPPMMLQVYGLDTGRHRWTVPFMRARLIRLYAESPSIKRVWTRIVSVKNSRVDLRASWRKHGSAFAEDKSIDVSAEAIRVGIPHQLVVHKLFDNIANAIKATEQLHHRFKTGTNEYILEKYPEGPKRVPKISIRSRAFLFELEDGPFEWKLGTIYRVGLSEQKQRLARDEAYQVKVKRLEELRQRRASSRMRTRSTQNMSRGRSQTDGDSRRRSHSSGEQRPGTSSRNLGHRGRKMRYDPAGVCGLTGSAKLCAEEAWYKLQEHNSQSWKKRIDNGMQFQKGAMKDIHSLFWGVDDMPDESLSKETILGIPDRPGLMTTLINDLQILIDKPSFSVNDYPKFLHRVGKGMPFDMKYSLLIPMNIQIEMGEARMTLRDYPLPLLHVPAIRPGQSMRLPSWSLRTDFVIAEEYRDYKSAKHVKVDIIPAEKLRSTAKGGSFAIDVRRTITPVKTYSDVIIDINTNYATRITWGTSYQPAIQEMMMIFEGFTKPQVDPSDRTGFWDKIRLSAHSRVNVIWKGDGDVHLMLKGSRDPYVVTGHGAGFVMCWRNDVRWSICQDDDPKKFMAVNSGEYVLAIPDYSHQARMSTDTSDHDSESIASSSSFKNGALFKKVIMKLSGNVRWLAGLVFERELEGGGRSFNFVPHYDVTLLHPSHAQAPKGINYDAFKGFRSHHIHLSIAVAAPVDRDWTVTNLKPSNNYNSTHLTPRFFTHFFSWWSMFSGAMSLPIRQGRLWPGIEKSSKKFSRHLATIKYSLLLSPLFISHIYKHKDAEDYGEDTVSATGLKVRLDSFMLDLHQRREEFTNSQIKGRLKPVKTTGMRINQAQLDFISADIRAVSASIAGTNAEDLKRATEETLASYHQQVPSIDMSRFTIPDNDFSWIDMDDFVELDWILPAESNPETKIMPLAFAPRFTYFRQTDQQDSIRGDSSRSSPFGNEPTHYCVMSHDNDPRRVQSDLIKERLNMLDEQMSSHKKSMGEQELRVVKEGVKGEGLKEQVDELHGHGSTLQIKKEFLQSMLKNLSSKLDINDRRAVPDPKVPLKSERSTASERYTGPDVNILDSEPLADFVSDFNNRFIVHNMQMKWGNSLRNIILRYIHQVSQRRGFVYYMSRRAVKFILDIVDEQNKSKGQRSDTSPSETFPYPAPSTPAVVDQDEDTSVEDRIQQLLSDGKKFVSADDPVSSEATPPKVATDPLGDNIAQDFTAQNSYHVRLIAPQIQLQSDKNPKSAVLVTAKAIQLKVIQIMDKDRVTDDVSGLVQRRFAADMESVQFFVTHQKSFSTRFLHMYSGNRYGTSVDSSWPPWVPMEVMFDFETSPFGFLRVVQKTSASLRYDKYNTLRLKYNDEINSGEGGPTHAPESSESRVDHLWVDFPHIRAICDSPQYYAMYIIVLDLLLYTEPLEKVRSERLEKIMLASDFSDLRGAPELVSRLQERIRQLEEIKMHFQVNARYLDRQGWADRLLIERDLTGCEDELFFMMKAITTSQRKYDDRSQTTGLLRWYLSASEIVWHMMREKNEPLLEFQLKDAAYERTDNSDGSNHNSMQIENIKGLNLLPNAIYPEMISLFTDNAKPTTEERDTKMLRVNWHMLEAIAGIPVLDRFEVNLYPLKVQLEREIGDKLFEYIFPSAGSNAFESGGFSPFMAKSIPPVEAQKEDDDSDTESPVGSPWTLPSSWGEANHSQDKITTPRASLEQRMKPTMSLADNKPSSSKPRQTGLHPSHEGEHHFRLFKHSNRSRSATRPAAATLGPALGPTKKSSLDSLRKRNLSTRDRSNTNLSGLNINGGSEKPKRFTLRRTPSQQNGEKRRPSDDLTQMMSRASNYMTLAYIKIPSVVLCLSYKGRGDRNIEDVHDFVFRMPVLEYRNKTWSNLDLALHLKKDVIRALISHTGAIIGNKFSHHRPNKQQTSRLREIANRSTMVSSISSNDGTRENSETSSAHGYSPVDDRSASPRLSFNSDTPSTLTRSNSFDSSHNGSYSRKAFLDHDSTSGSLADRSEGHGSVRHRLGRHFSHHGQRNSHAEAALEDSAESTMKKSKLLLGKKILGSLN
ncbi:MAG: hypothetical protein M1812_005390 [Candelaria pacifica]|nr:MAG: hypothetical protein M1812_005390 [Candelaria pacifica]